MRLSQCHPEIKHHAKGLCKACYAKVNSKQPRFRETAKNYYEVNRERILERFRQYRKTNKVRLAITDRKRKQRLGSGECQICKRFVKILCQDHDHKTGQLRGGLCYSCNFMLGSGKDNPKLLRTGALYLEFWTHNPTSPS